MDIILSLKKLLSLPKRTAIIMHTQPDADALGASLGLAAFLKKKRHQVNIITPTAYPDSLAWLPDVSAVIVYGEGRQKLSLELIKRADIIFCVDFAVLHRINELGEAVKNAVATTVIIDHHLDMEDFADLVLWNPKATAATELVYQLIEGLGKKAWIDKDIAECLYAGILTDTGSFRNPNTTANVHHITANLIEAGADIAKVNRLIYDNNSLSKLRFLSFAISQRLVVLAAYNTAYFIIKASDSRKFNLHTGDTEGLVNYALSIKGIVLAALINEKKDVVCLSLRSVGNFPVNVLAKEYFEGGGHKNAAGGISRLSLEETVTKFEELIKHNQHALKSSR